MGDSQQQHTISPHVQGTEAWHRERSERITASNFSEAAGFTGDRTELSMRVLGIKPSARKNHAMANGNRLEPYARAWYVEKFGRPVKECGLCRPSWDNRLGASPDGLVGDDGIIEIKCPMEMYDSVAGHEARRKQGETFGPFYHDHIPTSHYAQIQGTMKITGRHWCDYIVYCPPTVYKERIPYNEMYWENLYPKLKDFFLATASMKRDHVDATGRDPPKEWKALERGTEVACSVEQQQSPTDNS